jgi:hypothetical protein
VIGRAADVYVGQGSQVLAALFAEDIRAWFRQFRQDPVSPDESLEARGLILEQQGSA